MKTPKPYLPSKPEPKAPSYLGSFLVYEVFFILVAVLCFLAVTSIADFLGLELVEGASAYVQVVVTILLLAVLPSFLGRAALLRSQHSFGFRDGLRFALVDFRMLLSGLPLVGLLFTPPPSYGKPENGYK